MGLVQGYASGKAAGDTGYTLLLDASVGALTGIITPGIKGFTLLAAAGRLAVNAGGKYLRQRGKALQTGCDRTDAFALAAAAGASVLGDFGGELATAHDALTASKLVHYLPEEVGNLGNAASLAIRLIVQSAFNLEQEVLNASR